MRIVFFIELNLIVIVVVVEVVSDFSVRSYRAPTVLLPKSDPGRRNMLVGITFSAERAIEVPKGG
jgi:hypothetical protein